MFVLRFANWRSGVGAHAMLRLVTMLLHTEAQIIQRLESFAIMDKKIIAFSALRARLDHVLVAWIGTELLKSELGPVKDRQFSGLPQQCIMHVS